MPCVPASARTCCLHTCVCLCVDAYTNTGTHNYACSQAHFRTPVRRTRVSTHDRDLRIPHTYTRTHTTELDENDRSCGNAVFSEGPLARNLQQNLGFKDGLCKQPKCAGAQEGQEFVCTKRKSANFPGAPCEWTAAPRERVAARSRILDLQHTPRSIFRPSARRRALALQRRRQLWSCGAKRG